MSCVLFWIAEIGTPAAMRPMTGTETELLFVLPSAGFGAAAARLRLAEAALDDARRKAAAGLDARGYRLPAA